MNKNFFSKMNGWNRLFVLLSILWIAYSAYMFRSGTVMATGWMPPEVIALELRKKLYPAGVDLLVPKSDTLVKVKFILDTQKNPGDVTWTLKGGGCVSKTFVIDSTEIETECKFVRSDIELAYKEMELAYYKDARIRYLKSMAKKIFYVFLQLLTVYLFGCLIAQCRLY